MAQEQEPKLAVPRQGEVVLGDLKVESAKKPRGIVRKPARGESGLDSREGVIARLKQVCADPETKQDILLKALRQICEIRGFAAVPEMGEYRTMSNEKLTALMFDVCLIALREFGVRDAELLGVLCPACKATLKDRFDIDLEPAPAE